MLNKNYNRLRPNIFQGLSAKYEGERLTFSGAWFISEAIRGTMNTYTMANSYGVYGQGMHASGLRNNYHGNISSLGTGVFGAQYKVKDWKTQAWNCLGENVFNTTFIQSDYKFKHDKTEYIFGVQGFYQTALNNGGNADPALTYMQKDEQTYALGGKLGVKFIQQHELSLNYLGISDKGKFLFPKKWGREIFYASQPREVFEGYGCVSAYVIKYKFKAKEKNYAMLLGVGIVDQPSIENLKINKYALDDYYHFSIDQKYHFKSYMKGMSLRFIAAYKKERNAGSMIAAQKLNKLDMINLNLVIDYTL